MINGWNFRYIVGICIFEAVSFTSSAEDRDSTKVPFNLGATFTVTTKGISTIPNLTLGKPAAIVYFSMGRRFKFEPEIRWALDGKPWMFIFWGRRDWINNDHFYVKMLVNATVKFSTLSVTTNGITNDLIKANRTLTVDLAPNWLKSKIFSIGPYWMFSYGVEPNAVKYTNLLGVRANWTNVRLSDQYSLRFSPMIYFLNMDGLHGYYSNATLALSKKDLPFSASVLLNKTIQTEVPVGVNFLWNFSVIYTFNKQYKPVGSK